VIQRAAVLAYDRIEPAHLLIEEPASKAGFVPPDFMNQAAVSPHGASPMQEAQAPGENFPIQLPAEIPVDLPGLVEEIETYYLTQAARKLPSSRKIAKALGVSHTTVINRMKQLGIP
jgi:TyrR family helix-turn-helix protein